MIRASFGSSTYSLSKSSRRLKKSRTKHRIEAHIFIAFIAYCLHGTLKQYTKALAPGLPPRAVIEKLAAIQMIDVHLNTTDGRTVIMSRYTEPEKDLQLLLQRLKLALPAQSKPRITAEEVKRVA